MKLANSTQDPKANFPQKLSDERAAQERIQESILKFNYQKQP